MENPDWLLSVVLTHLGGPWQLLRLLPTTVIEAALQAPRFDSLPKDVLILVLSYTRLGDTFAVMRVAKAWYQATRTPAFWKRRIDAEKKRRKFVNPKFHTALMQFDTFYGPKAETLRDQLEWLRTPSLIRVEEVQVQKVSLYVVSRLTNAGGLLQHYYNEGGLYLMAWSSSCLFSIANTTSSGKVVLAWLTAGVICERVEFDLEKRDVGKLFLKAANYTWEGDAITVANGSSRSYTPHGDGKWTFSDGTIHEGEGVAWKGKPRYAEPPPKRAKDGPLGEKAKE